MQAVPALVVGFLGGLFVLGVVVYVVMLFNRVVRLRRTVDQAWSNVEVLLKQRHEEVPELVDAVRAYADHETDVLKRVTELRTQAERAERPTEIADSEARLAGALGDLFATAEDYPALRSSEHFRRLQGRLSAIEDRIADRREFYNASVTEYNTRIQQVPYNVAARLLGYGERDLFEATGADCADVVVDLGERSRRPGVKSEGGDG